MDVLARKELARVQTVNAMLLATLTLVPSVALNPVRIVEALLMRMKMMEIQAIVDSWIPIAVISRTAIAMNTNIVSVYLDIAWSQKLTALKSAKKSKAHLLTYQSRSQLIALSLSDVSAQQF